MATRSSQYTVEGFRALAGELAALAKNAEDIAAMMEGSGVPAITVTHVKTASGSIVGLQTFVFDAEAVARRETTRNITRAISEANKVGKEKPRRPKIAAV